MASMETDHYMDLLKSVRLSVFFWSSGFNVKIALLSRATGSVSSVDLSALTSLATKRAKLYAMPQAKHGC